MQRKKIIKASFYRNSTSLTIQTIMDNFLYTLIQKLRSNNEVSKHLGTEYSMHEINVRWNYCHKLSFFKDCLL